LRGRMPVRAVVAIQAAGVVAVVVDAVRGAGPLLVLEVAVAAQDLEVYRAELHPDRGVDAPMVERLHRLVAHVLERAKIRDLLGEDAVLERLRHVRAGPTGAALSGVVVTDGDGDGVPGGPLERRTVGERVGIFRRANGRIAVLVLVERLATLGEGGEAEREPLADRDVHHRLGEHLRVVAVLEAAARGPFPELRRRA